MPFFMNFANNIEIKCREICNRSETNSNDLKCKKDVLDDLKCKKTWTNTQLKRFVKLS